MKQYLTILQLEDYDIFRFIKWIIANLSKDKNNNKVDLKYTSRIKLIILTSISIGISIVSLSYYFTGLVSVSLILMFILCTQTYILIILGTLVIKPVDYFLNIYKSNFIRNKILDNKKLIVIGVTGSYGKTSTKEILYQLIKDHFKTLRTPESYNTLSGIYKTVDYELDKSYDFFICELSAYKTNDIKALCNVVSPTYGIITGVASQHLERFKSFSNIIKTKFELYDFIPNKNKVIFNTNNSTIANEILKRGIKNSIGYLETSDVRFSDKGTTFKINYKNKIYNLNTKLFGYANVENISGALTMALKLGLEIDYLMQRVKVLKPVQSRFVIKKLGEAMIVDNTFSSNEATFYETIRTATQISGKKLLITPGIVELGVDEDRINSEIGLAASKVFDKIILVGRNKRTIAFSNGLNKKVEFIDDNRKEYSEKIEEAKKTAAWIFLENDITQNYN